MTLSHKDGVSSRGSPQLNRWSRARSIRSGHRPLPHTREEVDPLSTCPVDIDSPLASPPPPPATQKVGKSILMVSDGTGWTAEHSVNAALRQFHYSVVDGDSPLTTHVFSGVNDVERLMEIIKQAAKEGSLLVYTLADRSMSESAGQACKLWGVPSIDVLSPITEAIASHLGVSPSGLPRGAPGRKFPLTEEYFKRIEAVEFTIKQDDGALPQNIDKADIVLVGVSRTGKTPLSIYIAQKGFKVANVPIVLGIQLPKSLHEIDPEKVLGLTIKPCVLQSIRKARAKTMGFNKEARGSYSDMDHIRKELDYASKIFAQNPTWPVIDMTEKATEETAAIVLRLYQDRRNGYPVPTISKRY